MQDSVLDNHFLLHYRFKAINEFLFCVTILLGKVEEIVWTEKTVCFLHFIQIFENHETNDLQIINLTDLPC